MHEGHGRILGGPDTFELEFEAVRRVREARQGPVQLEHVADGDNALGGVGASAPAVKAAEQVVVQPER